MAGSNANGGVGRRKWMAAAGACTVAVGLSGCGAASAASSKPALEGLGAGAKVGRWTIVQVHALRHGAVPVVLQPEGGERYQVDVLKADVDGPQAVAATDVFALFVSNRGAGNTPTDEHQGLGAMALARHLESEAIEAPSGLLTFAERAAKHPDGSFAVL